MAAPNSPIGSRRRLGAELRRLRNRSGLTLDDVAEQMTCSTSKISRLETGKGIPKVPDVRELMRIYGIDAAAEQQELLQLVHDGREHGWWESYTDGVQPERFMMDAPERYAALEGEATSIAAFEIAVLHGLLQTPDYTRAVLGAILSDRTPDELDRLVQLRGSRQQALTERDPPVELTVVLDESVLRRQVGGSAVMVGQLRRLLDLSRRPNVVIQVLPFEAGVHRALAGPFVVLGFPRDAGADVVYIEGHAGDTYLERESDVDLYRLVLADALRRALDPEATRDFIRRCLAVHRSPEGS